MSEADKSDKTELPTPKRLQDAREKGDVPRSKELANVAVLGVASIALLSTASRIGRNSQDWLRGALDIDKAMIGKPQLLLGHAAELFAVLAMQFLPILLAALAACLISPAVMSGLRFSKKGLTPDFKKLSPMAGFKRMFGKESLMELLRSLLRVTLVCGVGYLALRASLPALLTIPDMALEPAAANAVSIVTRVLTASIGSLVLLALIDVPWQHRQYRDKLKMTKQEVRDEHKQMEGNPELKARMRQVAREMSSRRMMEAVPTADVVLVNPTHYAVALKYDPAKMRAPVVVARGVDELALHIRDIASAHRVTVLESPPLARALYRLGRLDQEIPVKLYAAVAQVLTYLHQLRHWIPGRAPMPRYLPADVGADGAPDEDAASVGGPAR